MEDKGHQWKETGETDWQWDAVSIWKCEICEATISSYNKPTDYCRITFSSDLLPASEVDGDEENWCRVVDDFNSIFPRGSLCQEGKNWKNKWKKNNEQNNI